MIPNMNTPLDHFPVLATVSGKSKSSGKEFKFEICQFNLMKGEWALEFMPKNDESPILWNAQKVLGAMRSYSHDRDFACKDLADMIKYKPLDARAYYKHWAPLTALALFCVSLFGCCAWCMIARARKDDADGN